MVSFNAFMLTPDATLNGALLYLTTRRTTIGSKSGDLILIRLLTGFLFIYLYLFILFIIFHFKIVGSTPLIMHWYSSLDTLSSIEIITFLVQLLIWRLEENYIIQIISRLVGRTKKPKQTKTQKTQKTSTPTPPTPTKYHNIGTFPNWTGKNWKSSTIEWYHTTPNPSWFCKIK